MSLTVPDFFVISVAFAVIQFLASTWIKTRIETSIKHEYDTILTAVKYDYDTKLAALKHEYDAKLNLLSSRREVRIEYLIASYRTLAAAAHRGDLAPYAAHFESAIEDIQLLGTPSQAALAADFARTFAATGVGDLDALLADFRNDLRRELLLDPIGSQPVHLRILQRPRNDAVED